MRYPTALLAAIPALLLPARLPAQQAVAPCELLTDAEVTTVLPNHMSGDVDHAGPALIDGVNAYQCSWMDQEVHMLIVVVNSARDDATFAEIKPTMWGDNDAKKLALGDGGWVRGEPDDMKVTVLKGHFVLDLELMSPDAAQKADALVALAKAALAHL